MMVGKLLALGQVKAVEDAFQTFPRQVRVNVVPRQSGAQGETRGVTDNKYPTLAKYATDLTLLALSGKLFVSFGPLYAES